MGWWHDFTGTVTKAADTVVHTTTDVANTIADTATSTANAVADEVTKDANVVADQATVVAAAVSSTGQTVGEGFLVGAKAAGEFIEKGAEYTGKSLVESGQYVTEHACDIGVGSALSATFVCLAADGEEEVACGAFAAACLTVEKAELKVASRALAHLLGPLVYKVPGVSSVGDEKLIEDVMAFALEYAATQNPKMVVGTGGQVVAGILIATLTSLICHGKLPVDFDAWRKKL